MNFYSTLANVTRKYEQRRRKKGRREKGEEEKGRRGAEVLELRSEIWDLRYLRSEII